MRVLLVEDDAVMAEGIRLMLESEGMVVDVAEHGEDGLKFT